MSSWSYNPLIASKQMDQLAWIKLCKELELDGVELLDVHFPSLAKEYVYQVKKLIADLGLEISMCSVSNDFGKPDEAKRAESEKLVETWINASKWFGAPFLRIFSGWPGQNDPAKYESEKQKLWPEMIHRLQELSKKAEDAGIMLVLENHNQMGFTKTVDDLFRIITEVDSEWLGVCLDTGDYLVDTPDINGYAALEKAMVYTRIVHAKFYELDEEGKCKKQDWTKIFKILDNAVYDGWMSIEYEGKDCKNDVPRAARWLLDQTMVTARSRR
jgi:sugar phosphate isomerase/epimerase